MTYDRQKTANQFDRKVKEAQSRAKSAWGSGWTFLSDEQKSAFICREFVGLISNMDFKGAFGDKLDQPDIAEKLLQRLTDLSNAASKAF